MNSHLIHAIMFALAVAAFIAIPYYAASLVFYISKKRGQKRYRLLEEKLKAEDDAKYIETTDTKGRPCRYKYEVDPVTGLDKLYIDGERANFEEYWFFREHRKICRMEYRPKRSSDVVTMCDWDIRSVGTYGWFEK